VRQMSALGTEPARILRDRSLRDRLTAFWAVDHADLFRSRAWD
jgi:hypothetical protein